MAYHLQWRVPCVPPAMVVVAKSENLADLRLLQNIDSKHLVVSYALLEK
jgi:hypothetical protein